MTVPHIRNTCAIMKELRNMQWFVLCLLLHRNPSKWIPVCSWPNTHKNLSCKFHKFSSLASAGKIMLLFCQNIFGSMTVRHIRNISDMKNLRSNEMIFCCSCYFTKIIGSRVRLFLTKQWNVLHDKDFKKISVLCLQKKYIFIFAKCNLTSPTEFQIHTMNIITSFSCFFCNKDFTL